MATGEDARKQAVRSRIARVRRRLNLAVWLDASVGPVWVCVTAFVLWRVFVQRAVPLIGVGLFVAALAVTWWLGRSKRVSADAAAVVADRQGQLGGLLLTRLEVPVGGWELDLNTRLKALPLPAIEVRRSLGALGGGLAFLAVGLLVPQLERPVRATNAAAATRVESLAEKLDALAKEEPPDDAARAELERLRAELADSTFDAADWEASDALDRQLDQKAAEASAELARAEQAAKALSEAVAQAAEADGATRERDALERALMDLEATDGDEADGSPGADEPQPPGQADSSNTDNQSGQKSQPGQKNQKEQQGQNGKDNQAGQTQPSQSSHATPRPGQAGRPSAQQAKSMSGSQADELRRALEQRRQALSKAFGQGAGSKPGPRGATVRAPTPGRGRGNGAPRPLDPTSDQHLSHQVDPSAGHDDGAGGKTPLAFGKDAEMDPDRLAFEALPRGEGGEAGELFGLKGANPRVKSHPLSGTSSNAPAQGDQAPGTGEAPLLPRNRALIQRYFDSR